MPELESNEGKPNLTPMLDMVFQLVTFFMLVINFKSASLDLNLKLPVVGTAKPVDTKGKLELLVLNVDKNGRLNVYGRSYYGKFHTDRSPKERTGIESYIAGEAQASLFGARVHNPGMKLGDELPTTVVLRADKATRFDHVNTVITACQDVGFRKFALKAMNKKE